MRFAFTSQTWIFSLHSSIYVNESVRNDDDQSDGDEDDGNDVDDDFFWFIPY